MFNGTLGIGWIDATHMQIYFNGQNVGTITTDSSGSYAPTANIHLGGNNAYAEAYIKGIKVYSSIINGEDIVNRIETLEQQSGSSSNGLISDAYDPTASYNEDEYCIYNNTLYRCISMGPTDPGDFDPSEWTPTTVADELMGHWDVINSDGQNIVNLTNSIAPGYSSIQAYAVGDLIMKNCILYQCNTAISLPGETWTPAHWTQTTLASLLINGNNISY